MEATRSLYLWAPDTVKLSISVLNNEHSKNLCKIFSSKIVTQNVSRFYRNLYKILNFVLILRLLDKMFQSLIRSSMLGGVQLN